MDSKKLHFLEVRELESLAKAFDSGELKHGITSLGLQSVVPSLSSDQKDELTHLVNNGWTPKHLGHLCNSLAASKRSEDPFSRIIDLVISGPPIPELPSRSTKAVFNELVEEAKEEITIVSFALYNGKTLLKPLAEKMEKFPDFSVKLILNISRRRNDTTLSELLVRKFKSEFYTQSWSSSRSPSLYHFPSSLELDWKSRASLHSKVIIADKKRTFISSANLTSAAQEKNIETGVILNHPPSAKRILNYFEALEKAGTLVPIK